MSDPSETSDPSEPLGPRRGLALERAPLAFRPGRHGPQTGPAGATLTLVEGETRLNIEARRGRTPELVAALAGALGAAPVDAPETAAAGGGEIFGVGPSRWHAVFRGADAALRARAAAEAARPAATVVDVSHGFVVFRLEGPYAREALGKLVRVDLDPCAFAPGACVSTELGGMTAQIRRTPDGAAFECAAARSFAGSLLHALLRAGEAGGLEVSPVAAA